MVRTASVLLLTSALTSVVSSISFAAPQETWVCKDGATTVEVAVTTPFTEDLSYTAGIMTVANNLSGLLLGVPFEGQDQQSFFVRKIRAQIVEPKSGALVATFQLNKATNRLEFSGSSQVPFTGLFSCTKN